MREAMASVLAQTFLDWELIVWDDRSTDDSARIIAEYQDPRIHYFQSAEESSLGQARTAAIRQSTGAWLAFLDQDDVWLPEKLEKQIGLADDSVGLVYGRTVRFYPNGRERDYDQAHEFTFLPEGDIFQQLFTDSCFIAMSSAMFRRAAVDAVGGVPEAIRIIPDYWLYVAVARQYPVRAVQEVICRYRMHSANMSRTTAVTMHEEALWLVDQWARDLDPRTAALCRRRHFTAIALQEMRKPGTVARGVARLFTQGSPKSQLARPFMFAFHIIRRNVRRPYWRRLSNCEHPASQQVERVRSYRGLQSNDTLSPQVSIIMNVRNGAPFLREALDSVMAQTFQDWEVILWDDRSTDDSPKIVAECRDQRIRYFLSPEDTPLGEARNRAIRQANGQWLAFLDQDDVWLPRKLQQQMALADDDIGIMYGRALQFYPTGEERDYDYAHEFQPLPEGDIFSQLFADGCFIAMSSAILRRSAVEEVGPIPETIQTVPDYWLYAAVARRYAVRAVQEPVCRYRMHPGSMSRSKRRRLYEEPLWIVNQWAEHLDPQIVAYRRMTYSTGLALEEMRRLKTARTGLVRLFRQGSLVWLISRPLVRAWRVVRRRLRRPYWLTTEFASDPD